MTREEFIESSIKRHGRQDIDQMFELGFDVVPCDCGAEHCQGWRWDMSAALLLRIYGDKYAKEVQSILGV